MGRSVAKVNEYFMNSIFLWLVLQVHQGLKNYIRQRTCIKIRTEHANVGDLAREGKGYFGVRVCLFKKWETNNEVLALYLWERRENFPWRNLCSVGDIENRTYCLMLCPGYFDPLYPLCSWLVVFVDSNNWNSFHEDRTICMWGRVLWVALSMYV